jgi:hypothetical protein
MYKFNKQLFPEGLVLTAIISGVWLMVTVYAILHDQYIVRIAPEHFTVGHHGYGWIESAPLQAIVYANYASIYPGLLFGLVLAITTRFGHLPKMNVKQAYLLAFSVIVVAEFLSLLSGAFVYLRKTPLYPAVFYPFNSLSLVVTQTIQLTCYIVSLFGVGFVLILIPYLRWKRK